MGNATYIQKYIDIGIDISVLEWLPVDVDEEGRDILLLHGLASNARTWSFVAEKLAARGYHVFAIDQRGHGVSEKTNKGFDYDTIIQDLNKVIEALDLENPVLAGQSWGGNVLLEFAVRNQGRALGYIFVDGGYLELNNRGTWEEVSQMLKPPKLYGVPRAALKKRIQSGHPDWSDDVIEATMGNFETLAGGRVKPHLSLENHMAILRAMYEQDTRSLYRKVREPVLICVADDGSHWSETKKSQLQVAQAGITKSEVIWFKDAAHDVHQDRPDELSAAMLAFISSLAD